MLQCCTRRAAALLRPHHPLADCLLDVSLCQALRVMFGNRTYDASSGIRGSGLPAAAAVPAGPLEAHVTHWCSDPYVRGGYSFFSVGNPRNITGVCSRPVCL